LAKVLESVEDQPDSELQGMPPWERLDDVITWARKSLTEHAQLCRGRLEHLVEVRQPLVLISQIQRSGGTLLSQLFDAHPEVHAHPWELEIGHPRRTNWPQIDLAASPAEWYQILNEKPAQKLVRGYRKAGPWSDPEPEHHPFLYLPALRRAIFLHLVGTRPVEGERAVLDAYFTAYFNAWLDDHNLYTGPKKLVTGFAVRMNADPGSLDRFFDVYPDGVHITIVREPRAWYASARKLRAQFEHPEEAIELWRQSAQAGIEAAQRFGDRVLLLTYENLVLDTEKTMSAVADRLGIAFSPALLEPTFNGRPIRANSSHAVGRHGVLADRVDSYRSALDSGTIARVEELVGDAYERAVAAAVA
jgi:Sulfotransferase family